MTATPGPGPAADVDDGAARKLNLLGRIAFWAFLLIVILALLPFGANRPWSWSLLSLLLGAVTLLWVASKVLDRGRIAVPLRRCWPFLALFGLIVLWPLLQSSGFPPASWHHPLWSQAAEALGEPLNGAVSVNPGATREAVMRLLGYGAVFWLALQFGRNTYRARQLLWALACSAAPYALYGLIVKATGNDTILWFDKWAYPNSITSTFVNRNSYATFAGMGFLCTLGVIVVYSRGNLANPFTHGGMSRMMDSFGAGGWIFALMVLTVLTALLLTHSRGGFLSTLIGTLVLILSLANAHRLRLRTAMIYCGLFIAGTVLMIVISGTVTLQRIDQAEALSNERFRVFRLAGEAIGDAPLTGSGLGSFQWIFMLYREEALVRFYDKAHNSYLEFILGAGLPAFVVMISWFAMVACYCLRGTIVRQHDAIFPCLALAVLALAGTHALVDFSLQIPAVAVTFCLLLGLGVAQSWRVNVNQSRA